MNDKQTTVMSVDVEDQANQSLAAATLTELSDEQLDTLTGAECSLTGGDFKCTW